MAFSSVGTRRKKAAEPQAMEVDRAKNSEEIPQGTTTSTATKNLTAPCGDGKKKNKKKKGFREDCPSHAAHSLEVTPFKFLLRRVFLPMFLKNLLEVFRKHVSMSMSCVA